MFSKSILALALICIGTTLSEGNFNFALNNSTANVVLNSIESSSAIDLATRLILQQAPFLSSLPQDWSMLQKEQELLKTTARAWRSDKRRALFILNDGILAFQIQFSEYYDLLFNYTVELDDPEIFSAFVIIIEDLQSEVVIHKNEAIDSASQLKAFNHSVKTHQTILGEAFETIKSKYMGQNGAIQKLVNRIAKVNESYEWINEQIEMVTMDPSENHKHAVESAKNFSQLLREYQQLHRELAQLRYALNETHELQRNVESLAVNINQIVDAVNSIVQAWSQLDVDYGNVIRRIQSSPQKTKGIRNALKKAKTQWLTLSRRANDIKTNQLMNQASD